jgi:hypothetical protein
LSSGQLELQWDRGSALLTSDDGKTLKLASFAVDAIGTEQRALSWSR